MARQYTNGNANGSGGGLRARSAPNIGFARTSFLDGANAAYIEQLADRYARDAASLDPSWQEFFAQSRDDHRAAAGGAKGPSWGRDTPPPAGGGELIGARVGN